MLGWFKRLALLERSLETLRSDIGRIADDQAAATARSEEMTRRLEDEIGDLEHKFASRSAAEELREHAMGTDKRFASSEQRGSDEEARLSQLYATVARMERQLQSQGDEFDRRVAALLDRIETARVTRLSTAAEPQIPAEHS